MTVRAILSRKGSDVLTIEPAADLAAARLLAERRIGALVVTSVDNCVVGSQRACRTFCERSQ